MKERVFMQRFALKYIGNILALSCLLFLAACSSGGGQPPQAQITPTPTAAATPTPVVPAGTVLYQADWSKGLASWTGSKGWTIVDGNAQSDTSKNDALIIPYTPIDPNYEVDYRFQIVEVPQSGASFFLQGIQSKDKDGYEAGVLNLLQPGASSEFGNPQIQIEIDPTGDMERPVQPADYEPGNGWHTFRVKIQESEAIFYTDALRKGDVFSSRTDFLTNGPIQLVSTGVEVRVSSITITAL
jgi:hypothetical protein